MTRKKVATTIYITAEQDRQLKLLGQAMALPMAELIRQGIDHILTTYRHRLPSQLGLFPDPPAQASSAPPSLTTAAESEPGAPSAARKKRAGAP